MVGPNVRSAETAMLKDRKSHQTAKNGPRMLSYFVPVGKKIKNKLQIRERIQPERTQCAPGQQRSLMCKAVVMLLKCLFFFFPSPFKIRNRDDSYRTDRLENKNLFVD